MSRFAGDDPRRIHLERDAEFLIELPSEVQILDITASLARSAATLYDARRIYMTILGLIVDR